MKKIKPLPYKLLKKQLSPAKLKIKTTDHVRPLTRFIGQERALEALKFGIGIPSKGYNLYAMGPSGIGKFSLVHAVLEEEAKKIATPPDWCYIHNFEIPEKPIALQLPPGLGFEFQQDMKHLVDELGAIVVALLESREYSKQMKAITDQFKRKRKSGLNSLIIREENDKLRSLQEKLLNEAMLPTINKRKKKYAKFPAVITHIKAVQRDIVLHLNDFIREDEKTNLLTFSSDNPVLVKYKVNLLVDNRNLKGAPIVFEENPSYSALISRIEHISHLGTLTTNFSLIRAGSLQRANGGFLIIEARKLRKNPDAWQALKSALHAKLIKIKPVEHEPDSIRPVSLEPMPIPLNIKIVLIGDRNTYYTLSQNDSDFTELFKVAADFAEQIDRNAKNIQLYARLVSTISHRENLKPFHASAIAEIIDYSSRLTEDVEKLSTHIRDIEDLIMEASYWATLDNKKHVSKADVKKALKAQTHRMDRTKELYHEDILRDFVIIKTSGKVIGQVNCLSVRRVGNFSYGHPTRVTARVRIGNGKLIDIQREIKMAGPLHSKASLTIANFLASHFQYDHPFSLSASISFEQIYCWTEGDSASVGELCALISAITEVPINQSLAITGSIDQHGEVQAIGGVNEKIEGFFDICKARGLTGKQGVLIPAVNIKNLMLRDDVVEAAKNKQFFIYPIETIDDAVALLTGHKVGTRDKQGKYPADSLYHTVEKRLHTFLKNSKKKIIE